MHRLHFEQLNDTHSRGEFSCGKAPLDLFLRERANQYSRRNLARTFVAVQPGGSNIVGYYSLAASALQFESLPPALSKRLPMHPVSTVLIGRLAVDLAYRGQGFGGDLLMDACRRIVALSDQVGVFAIHVHALDDEAKGFYEHFGFVSLIDQPRHLIWPISSVRKLNLGGQPS